MKRHLRTKISVLVSCVGVTLVYGCASGKRAQKVDYSADRHDRVIASSKENVATNCPAGMVLIPSGPTLYGPSEEANLKPNPKELAQRINMKSFCIDKYEYPNEPGEAPLRSVSWVEAGKTCGERGKRLCSEYEFEKACRGPSGTLYTYGDGYADKVCPTASETYGLGQFENCVSGFNVHDMSGGVFEWTSSINSSDNPNAELRIVRGGLSTQGAEQNSKCTFRSRRALGKSDHDVGFRCCAATLSIEEAEPVPARKK